MRFGVVIPAYNHETLLLETLESVAAQTVPAHRVVISDDCSTDATATRAQEWIDRQAGPTDWVVIRANENGGVAKARNLGARHAQDCDLLTFLDSDDLWAPTVLETIATAAESHPDASAFVAEQHRIDASCGDEVRVRDYAWLDHNPIPRMARRGNPGPSCVFMRRAAYDSIGAWNEEVLFLEDFVMCAELSLLGPIVSAPGAPVHYRLGVGSARGEAVSLCHDGRDHAQGRVEAFELIAREHDVPGFTAVRARAWFSAARYSYRRRDWAECERRCKRSLRLAPWYPRPALLWAFARARRGQFDT